MKWLRFNQLIYSNTFTTEPMRGLITCTPVVTDRWVPAQVKCSGKVCGEVWGASSKEIVTRLTGSEECHVPNLRVVVPGRLCLYARPPQGSDLGFQGAGLRPLGIHGAVLTWSCLTWARQVWLLKPRALLERTIPELGGGGKGTTRNSRAYNSVTQVSLARCQHCALFHSCPPAVLTLQESWNPSRSPRAQLPTPTGWRLGAPVTEEAVPRALEEGASLYFFPFLISADRIQEIRW